jgi:tRNA 2-thiouridine synthesizing protein B
MLHTVNKSPFQTRTLESCLRMAKKGSAILLIEDGVYAALADSPFADRMREALSSCAIYVLGPDVRARGIESRLLDGIKEVDYGGFVDLVIEYKTFHAWL